MNFKDEIKNIIGDFSFFSVLLSQKGGYIQGVKKLVTYSKENIILQTTNGKLNICGKDLEIGKFIDSDFSFSGSVSSLNVEKSD